MADKDCFWHQHQNIPPNVIGVLENDLMCGRVVYVPRPSANRFDNTIEWDMSCLPYGFPIAQYPLCTCVDNMHDVKLHLQLAINRYKTGSYTFTEPRVKIVQIQGQAAAPTSRIGCRPQTRSRKSADVLLIAGMQHVSVTYNNAEDD